MKFLIKEVYEIIEGYSYSTYEVEAKSEDEAIELVNNGEIDPIEFDTDIHASEFMERNIKRI